MDRQIIPGHERMSFFFSSSTPPHTFFPSIFLSISCLYSLLPIPKIFRSSPSPSYFIFLSTLYHPPPPPQPVFLLSSPSRCWFLIVLDRLVFFLSSPLPLPLSLHLSNYVQRQRRLILPPPTQSCQAWCRRELISHLLHALIKKGRKGEWEREKEETRKDTCTQSHIVQRVDCVRMCEHASYLWLVPTGMCAQS